MSEKRDGTVVTLTFDNAKFSPTTPCNLVSDGKLKKMGYIFDGFRNLITDLSGEELCAINWVGDVTVFDAVDIPMSTPSFMAVLTAVDYSRLHERFMHAGDAPLRALAKKAGVTIVKAKNFSCEACLENRLQDHHGVPATLQYTEPGQLIRFDLIVFEQGFLGYKYTVHYIDMATNHHWVRFSATKAEAFDLTVQFVAYFECQSGKRVQGLGCDNGPEFGLANELFKQSKMRTLAKKKGIALLLNIPHSPWQNGKAEKAGFDIVSKAKTAHNAAKLPHYLWPFTMQSACTVLNLLPTSANAGFKSPVEALAEKLGLEDSAVPTGGYLRVIGSDIWVHVKKAYSVDKHKYTKSSIKMKLLAWDSNYGRIFWACDPEADKVVRVVAIKIVERKMPKLDDKEFAGIEYVAEVSATSVDEEFSEWKHIFEAKPAAISQTPLILQPPHHENEDHETIEDKVVVALEEQQPSQAQQPTPETSPEAFPEPDPSRVSGMVEDIPQGVSREEVLKEEKVLPPSRGRGGGRGHGSNRVIMQPTTPRTSLRPTKDISYKGITKIAINSKI